MEQLELDFIEKNQNQKAHCSQCNRHLSESDIKYNICFATSQEKYDSSLFGKTPCLFIGDNNLIKQELDAVVAIKKRISDQQKSTSQK